MLSLKYRLERVTAEDVVIDETLYVLDKGLENGRVPLERLMSVSVAALFDLTST